MIFVSDGMKEIKFVITVHHSCINVMSLIFLTEECSNNHKLCQYWAQTGECNKNPAWMNVNCAQSCRLCGKYKL